MRVCLRVLFAAAAIAAMLAACSGSTHSVSPIRRDVDGFRSASWQDFQLSGTAKSVSTTANGSVRIDLGARGHLINAVPALRSALRFVIVFDEKPGRELRPLFEQLACEGCEDGTASPSPKPQTTPPPNYDACSRTGGATWWNNITESNGCIHGFDEQPLSCGRYQWYAPGKGKIIFNDGTELVNIRYAIDRGDSCTLG